MRSRTGVGNQVPVFPVFIPLPLPPGSRVQRVYFVA